MQLYQLKFAQTRIRVDEGSWQARVSLNSHSLSKREKHTMRFGKLSSSSEELSLGSSYMNFQHEQKLVV